MDIVELAAASRPLVESLREIDTSFTTSTTLEVNIMADGVSWQERRLSEPLVKRYSLFDDDLPTQPDSVRRGFVASAGVVALGLAVTHFSAWNRRQVLTNLFVDASARRRGVARQLIEHVLVAAAANQAREVWLETQNVNVPAIRAYQALSFRISGCDLTLYDTPHCTERAIFMSRPMSR